eukprot:5606474-Prymnesium_polylepis.5
MHASTNSASATSVAAAHAAAPGRAAAPRRSTRTPAASSTKEKELDATASQQWEHVHDQTIKQLVEAQAAMSHEVAQLAAAQVSSTARMAHVMSNFLDRLEAVTEKRPSQLSTEGRPGAPTTSTSTIDVNELTIAVAEFGEC